MQIIVLIIVISGYFCGSESLSRAIYCLTLL